MIVRFSCVLALTLTGCGGELVSDYTLNLVPHTLQGQAPFASGRTLELVVVEPDGVTTSVYYVGEVSGNEVRAEDMPPVEVGSQVGLLVEGAGGTAGQIDPDLVVAWGSALVTEELALGEKTIDLGVMVAEVGVIGDLGVLGQNRLAMGAGVAMLPSGAVYIFGGADDYGGQTSDQILKMVSTDTGVWNFEKLNTTIPTTDDRPTRYMMAASVVEVDGAPLIFVSGGRETGVTDTIPGNESETAFLFDPAQDKVTWGHKDSHQTLSRGISEHRHVVMDNQHVLVYGGFTSSLGTTSIELFNPKSKSFNFVNSGLTHGNAQPAGASLGTGGALVCGGAELNSPSTNFASPVDNCDQITLGGVVTETSPMPTPVMAHAMARLADGRVLATGGVTQTVPDNDSVAATSEAWIYDGVSWTPLTDPMKNPRAHHEIIPLPDGDAIILGGTGNGGAVFPGPSPAVVCAERFDAQSGTFREVKPCSGAGSGAFPRFSAVEGEGAFLFAGFEQGAATPKGDTYGFLAFTPDF